MSPRRVLIGVTIAAILVVAASEARDWWRHREVCHDPIDAIGNRVYGAPICGPRE